MPNVAQVHDYGIDLANLKSNHHLIVVFITKVHMLWLLFYTRQYTPD